MRATALRPWTCAAVVMAAASLLTGCPSSQFKPASAPTHMQDASPLGAGYVLIPVPSDDDGVLGRVLAHAPEAGHSIEEQVAPNPCLSALEAVKTSPMDNTFEDARELSAGARARATLGMFGLNAEAQRATHFVYMLRTERRVSRATTSAYLECCKQKDCGVGYVSALVYGSGAYASAEEYSGGGGIDVAIAGASGTATLKFLSRRNVKGYIAAVVTTTGADKGNVGVLGVAEAAGITELGVPQQVKALYDSERIEVRPGDSPGEYVLAEGRGAVLTENEFVRRYAKVTGNSELQGAQVRRNYPKLIVWGSVVALSAGLIVWAETTTKCTERQTYPEDKCLREETGNPPVFWAGVGGAVLGAAFLIPAIFDYDGKPSDHRLSEYDARFYVAKHNRALLRRAVKDVQGANREGRGPALHPWIGLGGAGLRATF